MGLCTKCSACCESFWQAVEKGNFKRWVRLPRTPCAPALSKACETCRRTRGLRAASSLGLPPRPYETEGPARGRRPQAVDECTHLRLRGLGRSIYGGNPLPTGLRVTHARLCVLAPDPPPHSLSWLLLLAGRIFRDPVCVPPSWSSDFHGEFDAGPSLPPVRAEESTCLCRVPT